MLLYTRQKNHHIIRKIKKPDVRKIGTALIIFAFIPDQGPLMHMEVMEDPEKWTIQLQNNFLEKKVLSKFPEVKGKNN